MKHLLLLAAFVCAPVAFATESQTIDIGHLMKKPEAMKDESSNTLKTECTSLSGKVHKKGDPAFNDCLSEAAHRVIHEGNVHKKNPAQVPGTPGSVSTGIQFGTDPN